MIPRRLCDAVGLRPAPGFSVTGTTERRRSQSLRSTSMAQVASPVEAGPVPTLGRGAILAIDRYKDAHKDPLITQGTAPLEDALFRAAVFEQLGESRLEGAVTTDIVAERVLSGRGAGKMAPRARNKLNHIEPVRARSAHDPIATAPVT